MLMRPQQYLLHDHWLFIFISHISNNSAHILIYIDFDFYLFIVLGRLLLWVLAFFKIFPMRCVQGSYVSWKIVILFSRSGELMEFEKNAKTDEKLMENIFVNKKML